MVTKTDKETQFYKKLLGIIQSSIPDKDKMRLIAELLLEKEEKDDPKG